MNEEKIEEKKRSSKLKWIIVSIIAVIIIASGIVYYCVFYDNCTPQDTPIPQNTPAQPFNLDDFRR